MTGTGDSTVISKGNRNWALLHLCKLLLLLLSSQNATHMRNSPLLGQSVGLLPVAKVAVERFHSCGQWLHPVTPTRRPLLLLLSSIHNFFSLLLASSPKSTPLPVNWTTTGKSFYQLLPSYNYWFNSTTTWNRSCRLPARYRLELTAVQLRLLPLKTQIVIERVERPCRLTQAPESIYCNNFVMAITGCRVTLVVTWPPRSAGLVISSKTVLPRNANTQLVYNLL